METELFETITDLEEKFLGIVEILKKKIEDQAKEIAVLKKDIDYLVELVEVLNDQDNYYDEPLSLSSLGMSEKIF